MESPLPLIVAGLVAGVLTYLDLDGVFDEPPHALDWGPWLRLRSWWWGFIAANGVLAGFLYFILKPLYFKDVNEWFGALLAGAGYTALIRLKFATLPNDVPLGLEALYLGIRKLVHRRINRIVRAWRMQACASLAVATLPELRERALLMVGSDVLLNEEERKATTEWIKKTADDASIPELDRRRALAIYIITERRPS